jgi:hypothetical protein
MLSTVNPDDFTVGQESAMDAQLLVRFFMKPKQNKAATAEQGRPIFKDVEYCEIRVRGNRDPQACRPATFADKKRFPRHYDAFQKRVELPEEGTPLSEWPQISRSQVEELSFVNIKTVEQLVEVADTHISKVQGGYALKQKATDWIKNANDNAKLAKTNREQAAQIEDLTEKVNQLLRAHTTGDDITVVAENIAPDNTILIGSALDADLNDDLEVAEAEKPVKRKSRRKPKAE